MTTFCEECHSSWNSQLLVSVIDGKAMFTISTMSLGDFLTGLVVAQYVIQDLSKEDEADAGNYVL